MCHGVTQFTPDHGGSGYSCYLFYTNSDPGLLPIISTDFIYPTTPP